MLRQVHGPASATRLLLQTIGFQRPATRLQGLATTASARTSVSDQAASLNSTQEQQDRNATSGVQRPGFSFKRSVSSVQRPGFSFKQLAATCTASARTSNSDQDAFLNPTRGQQDNRNGPVTKFAGMKTNRTQCTSSMNSANESADWEPLLEPNGKVLPKRPAGGTGGIAGTNRRETKSLYQEKWGRIRLGVLVVLAFATFYLSLSTITLRPVVHQMVVNVPEDDEDLPGPRVPKGFLVWGPGCKMLDLDPLADDVMRLFRKERFEPCSPKKPLTTIEQDFENDSVVLRFHRDQAEKHLPHYMKFIECCYQSIERSGVNEKADKNFNLSECKYFSHDVQLPPNVTNGIMVRCKGSVSEKAKTRKSVYTNVHAFIRKKPAVQERLDRFRQSYKQRPLSVLMIGIDSISRLNLIRAMPHTAQHLYDTGWFELKGYNKIDDNTYPNLMAILTGYNNTLAYDVCNPRKVGQLETCPFLWKYFADSGYVTAYAEDEASINTFNYHKFGFVKQPTDYYLRPMALAAEKNLVKKLKNSLTFCLGYQHYADFIYQYALDFATFYKDEPNFGLFWTNTFSHNDISDPSSMDLRMKHYVEELQSRGILNNSMVIFFSDHGIRFGAVRSLLTGWLEERLPFMFMWLPDWFKEEHPQIVQALKVNRNRLTNPYDLHATLKHVLELSERIDNLPMPLSCPNCQSIFQEMPWNRSCEETSIAPHWCTCSDYEKIDKGSRLVQEAAGFVIDSINEDLAQNQRNLTKKLCAKMQLKSTSLAKIARYPDAETPHNDYLLIIDGKPGNGKFESTVRHYTKLNKFEITGSISRLNEYASQSECMHVDYLRKYCYCLRRKGG